MLTFVELRDARPESLVEAAEAWDSRARLVSLAVRALDEEVLEQLKDWGGVASRAAVTKLTRAAERLAGACMVMFGVANKLADTSKLISRARGDLQDAIEFAHSKGLEVEDDGSVLWRLNRDPLGSPDDYEAAQHVERLIRKALQRATEADADATAYLEWAWVELAEDPDIPLAEYRPYDTEEPTMHDRWVEAQAKLLPGGATYVKNWHVAAVLMRHWLDRSGSAYDLNVRDMLKQLPSFQKQVDRIVAGHESKEEFDSGWQGAQANEHESLDYYYALHDFRFRVVGGIAHGGRPNAHSLYRSYTEAIRLRCQPRRSATQGLRVRTRRPKSGGSRPLAHRRLGS